MSIIRRIVEGPRSADFQGFSESAWGVFANSFAAASDGVVDWGSNRRRVAEADVFLCLDDGSDGEKARRRVPHTRHRDNMKSGEKKNG